MYYKTSIEIYLEEIRDKGLYIPRLSFQDEASLQVTAMMVTELARILNEPWVLVDYVNPYFLWNYFQARLDYFRNVKELYEFLKFWGLDANKEYHIEKFYGQA